MIVNPVLAKELNDRVRTWRSPLMITLYVAILAVVGGLFFYLETMGGMRGPRVLRMGVTGFNLLAFLQLLLIAFLTPGLTAGVISGERERQTLPLLMITKLSPFSVATGKLLSAISYIALLIVVSLPLYSVVFFFGGVSLKEFLQTAGIYLATTLTLGSIGLCFSSLFKRTTVAIVVTYGVTFFLLVGTFFVAGVMESLTYRFGWAGPQPPPLPFILYFNPLFALGSALPLGNNFIPFLRPRYYGPGGGGGGGVTAAAAGQATGLDPWQIHLLLDGGIILLTLALTIWLIHPLRAGTKRRG